MNGTLPGSNGEDELYQAAKAHLQSNPDLDKSGLAKLLKCSLNTARRLLKRFGARKWSKQEEMEIVREVAWTNYRKVAKARNCSRGRLWSVVRRHKGLYKAERSKRTTTTCQIRQNQIAHQKSGDGAEVVVLSYSGPSPKTVDELVREESLDPDAWQITKREIGHNHSGNGGTIFFLRVWLRREEETRQLLPEGHLFPCFEGFLNVSLTFQELRYLIQNRRTHPDWYASLSAVGGIYLIVTAAGEQYVGSASGRGGIWRRWEAYASPGALGDGGNIALKRLIQIDGNTPRGFRFSLLHTFSTAIAPAEVARLENLYKKKLGSRAFGLNRN